MAHQMTSSRRNAHAQRDGFIILDAVFGLTIIGILTVAMATATGRQRSASLRLADSRSAVRIAEAALLDMQSNRQPGEKPVDCSIVISPAAGAQEAVKGFQWVKVNVVYRGRSASLIGLVPESNMPPSSPKARSD